jgi:hypothetical protein
MLKEWSVVVGEVEGHNDVGIARASATDGFGLGFAKLKMKLVEACLACCQTLNAEKENMHSIGSSY